MRKKSWSCEKISLAYDLIPDVELRQRLALLIELLFNSKSQFGKQSAFFTDSCINQLKSSPCQTYRQGSRRYG